MRVMSLYTNSQNTEGFTFAEAAKYHSTYYDKLLICVTVDREWREDI
jgi:hypothetical protein